MVSLLEPRTETSSGGTAEIGEGEIPTFHFQYNHPSMGVVTIRRAEEDDFPAVQEWFERFGRTPGPPHAGGIVLLVTREVDAEEKFVAAVSVCTVNIVSDLRRALKHAPDGDAWFRIERLPSGEGASEHGCEAMMVCKDAVRKILDRRTRRRGTIFIVKDSAADREHDDEATLKFFYRKIVRILKYLYGCSHLLFEAVENAAGAGGASTGAASWAEKMRKLSDAVEIGYREAVPPPAERSAGSALVSGERTVLLMISCERILGAAQRAAGNRFPPIPFSLRGRRKIVYAQPLPMH